MNLSCSVMTRLYSLTFSCNEGKSKSFFNSTSRDNWSKPICLHPMHIAWKNHDIETSAKVHKKEESGEYKLTDNQV